MSERWRFSICSCLRFSSGSSFAVEKSVYMKLSDILSWILLMLGISLVRSQALMSATWSPFFRWTACSEELNNSTLSPVILLIFAVSQEFPAQGVTASSASFICSSSLM